MPRVLPILTVAALAVALVGCTASEPTPEPTPDSTSSSSGRECAAPGAASDSVKVSGEFGALPTVDFTAPLEVERTERTVVTEGDGAEAVYGSVVSMHYSFYNARSGEVIESTDYTEDKPAVFTLDESKLMAGLLKTVECSTIGSRVVGVTPASDAFGEEGLPEYGIEAGDALLFVVDVFDAATRATGAAQDVPEGFPTVVLAADGAPTITIPEGFALPTESQTVTLIEGTGRQVLASDTVFIQYQGVDVATGEIFDQTWGGVPYSGQATGFISGFSNALISQKVGSQFLVVIPPTEGYGEASDTNTHELAGKTLVFVVDILAVIPGA